MTTQLLNLPLNIPWTLVATSPDMMDQDFCDKQTPNPWRPSVSIYVYEPPIDELPETLCGDRLTYIKVSTSITGYQPEIDDRQLVYTRFRGVPYGELKEITDLYLGCYGALINVSVFPGTTEIDKEVSSKIDFSTYPIGSDEGTTFSEQGVTFESNSPMTIGDIVPSGGDGEGELTISDTITVTLPDAIRATVWIVPEYSDSDPISVTVEAFSEGARVDSSTAIAPGQLTELSFSAPKLTSLKITPINGMGALLAISFVTMEKVPVTLKEYPHIVDAEPKNRDLYQSATETGEVLTASVSRIATDKSMQQGTSSETGFDPKVTDPESGAQISGISHKWGATSSDTYTVRSDSSQDSREREGTTTNLTQMYNLLTGYHVGTNHVSFLMLPRPHLKQPTEFRTFVQGLRVIEGIQDFFLVVRRPAGMKRLSLEASLDTGHYPEDTPINDPEENFVTKPITFTYGPISVSNSWKFGIPVRRTKNIDKTVSNFEHDGFQFDPTGGDPGHGAVSQTILPDDDLNGSTFGISGKQPALEDYDYQSVSPDNVVISGTVRSEGIGTNTFHRKYTVHLRRPIATGTTSSVDVGNLLITNKKVCVTIESTGHCPLTFFPAVLPDFGVIDELPIEVATRAFSYRAQRESKLPAVVEFLNKIRKALVRPSSTRGAPVRFTDTDLFHRRAKVLLDDRLLKQRIRSIDILPSELSTTFPNDTTVEQLLEDPAPQLAHATGVAKSDILKARRLILELPDREVLGE